MMPTNTWSTKVTNPGSKAKQHDGDSFMMERVICLPGISNTDLKAVQQCHLYLKATTISVLACQQFRHSTSWLHHKTRLPLHQMSPPPISSITTKADPLAKPGTSLSRHFNVPTQQDTTNTLAGQAPWWLVQRLTAPIVELHDVLQCHWHSLLLVPTPNTSKKLEQQTIPIHLMLQVYNVSLPTGRWNQSTHLLHTAAKDTNKVSLEISSKEPRDCELHPWMNAPRLDCIHSLERPWMISNKQKGWVDTANRQ
jgi:hypothetical protein